MSSDTTLFKKLSQVEQLIGNMEHEQALKTLQGLDASNAIVRRFTIECLVQLEKDQDLIALIDQPRTLTEFTFLVESLWKVGRIGELERLLKEQATGKFVDSQPYQRMKKKILDRKDKDGKN